jgi:hypothetical protein
VRSGGVGENVRSEESLGEVGPQADFGFFDHCSPFLIAMEQPTTPYPAVDSEAPTHAMGVAIVPLWPAQGWFSWF